MSEDILPKGPSGEMNKKKTHHNISLMAGILAILLAVVMIILGERIMFDLNRSLNPVVSSSGSTTTSATTFDYAAGIEYEASALSSQRIGYPTTQQTEYKLYRMLIHSAFIIPVFLLVFVVYFKLWHKNDDSPFKVVLVGYLVFAFWMILRLIFEVGGYVLEKFANVGVYVVLIFLAAIFTWLMILLQKKFSNKHNG